MIISKVLIVGGGSSGWMTAAALAHQIPNLDITLLESSDIPTVGVGESTINQFNQYLDFIGLKDDSWMPYCDAVYKTTIKFTDFHQYNKDQVTAFHYPFGKPIQRRSHNPRTEFFDLRAIYPEDFPASDLAPFYHPSVFMADAAKMTNNKNEEIEGFDFDEDNAYQFDASLFGKYLKEHMCLPKGVKHVVDTMTHAELDDNGYMTKVVTDSGLELTADLFIDCTGFKSELLEGYMGAEFTSFNDVLLNDRAIVTPLEYLDKEVEMQPTTNCTAIECGWVWNTPLWSRIGSGYVYSSKFATEEEALEQFKKHLVSDRMDFKGDKKLLEERLEKCSFRSIKMKHGAHEKSWVKNVVAVGLANGFIEPLESTGLFLTHEAIIKLTNVLKARDGRVVSLDRTAYNKSLYDMVIGWKNFLSLHYSISKRNDTPYWRYLTDEIEYSGEANYRFVFKTVVELNVPGNIGSYYIFGGQGYNVTTKEELQFRNKGWEFDARELKRKRDWWIGRKQKMKELVKTLPSHYEFLKNTIYKES